VCGGYPPSLTVRSVRFSRFMTNPETRRPPLFLRWLLTLFECVIQSAPRLSVAKDLQHDRCRGGALRTAMRQDCRPPLVVRWIPRSRSPSAVPLGGRGPSYDVRSAAG